MIISRDAVTKKIARPRSNSDPPADFLCAFGGQSECIVLHPQPRRTEGEGPSATHGLALSLAGAAPIRRRRSPRVGRPGRGGTRTKWACQASERPAGVEKKYTTMMHSPATTVVSFLGQFPGVGKKDPKQKGVYSTMSRVASMDEMPRNFIVLHPQPRRVEGLLHTGFAPVRRPYDANTAHE